MAGFQSMLVLCLLSCGLMAWASAEEPISTTGRTKNLQRMREVAGRMRVLANPQRADSAVKLKDEPVLNYSDGTRQTHESSLWIWADTGRPVAILAVEFYTQDSQGPRRLYEIASLSTDRISAEMEGNFQWTADEPGLNLQALPDAPSPAAKEVQRLVQMKALRGRFTAHEHATFSGRLELRPLVTPLLRYSDVKKGLIDGAIFTFANGTNPEVLLVLEAHQMKAGTGWQYALVRMTGEAVTVQLDGKEIWQQTLAEPPAVRENYINGWLATRKDEK